MYSPFYSRFFETYWDCLTKVYKSKESECPHWQIPMLLILQKTALPSLFGMSLRADQIGKLEVRIHTNKEKNVDINNKAIRTMNKK